VELGFQECEGIIYRYIGSPMERAFNTVQYAYKLSLGFQECSNFITSLKLFWGKSHQ